MDYIKNKQYSKSESNIGTESLQNNIKIKKKYDNNNDKTILNKNMFEFIFIIGKGGFGKVWRVKEKKTKELYALKEMSKTKVIDKKSEKSINGEREFLSYLHHPFIVNMHYAFQDHENLYLVMDLLTGGDLRYHCSRYRSFSEEQTRFFLACIIHSLSYIHKNKVIHRDIKPENLVLDDKGYVRITDFGIAKINMPDNSSETSGTPGYMCPEIMYGKNHSFPADYFSIGVIGYEFMMGKRPYKGRGRKEIKEQMLTREAKIEEKDRKEIWSIESVDFINKLLKRKEEERLGSKNGIKELKEHAWMKYYPWNDLYKKKLAAPFIPDNLDNFDKKYCESTDEISDDTLIRYEEIMFSEHFNVAFSNFFYNKNDIKNNYKIEEDNTDTEEDKEDKEEKKEEKEEKEEKSNKNEESNNSHSHNNQNISRKIIKLNIKKSNIKKDNDNNNNDNDNNNLNENKYSEIKEEINESDRLIENNSIINNEYIGEYICGKQNNEKKTKKLKKISSNKNHFFLPKNNSEINIINKNKNNNSNIILEPKRTIDNFIDIKKICINCNNIASKINNQKKMFQPNNIKFKNEILQKKNVIYNNNLKLKSPIKNIFNINNNEIHNVNNNNNNVNIFLSINMFNKMLNNQKNSYNSFKGKNYPLELYKRKPLNKIEKNRNMINNYYNPYLGMDHNGFLNSRIKIGRNNKKVIKSNSVGIHSNKSLNNSIKNFSLDKYNIGHILFSKNKHCNNDFFNNKYLL